jgi:hypothetical protein
MHTICVLGLHWVRVPTLHYFLIKNKSMQNLIETIERTVSNRKKYDKHSVGYLIGMMDFHNTKNLFVDTYKRGEVLEEFRNLIRTEKIDNIKHIFSNQK